MEPKINEEAKQISFVMQEKILQSSQIIHELGIKGKAIVLYHKYSPMPGCIYKDVYVCVFEQSLFECEYIYIYIHIYLYLQKKSV